MAATPRWDRTLVSVHRGRSKSPSRNAPLKTAAKETMHKESRRDFESTRNMESYTCQLTRIMRVSHACGSKTSITCIEGNLHAWFTILDCLLINH